MSEHVSTNTSTHKEPIKKLDSYGALPPPLSVTAARNLINMNKINSWISKNKPTKPVKLSSIPKCVYDNFRPLTLVWSHFCCQ